MTLCRDAQPVDAADDRSGATCADLPVVLHVRTISGTGGGPDKTILRSSSAMPVGRYRVEVACIHPAGQAIAGHLAAEAQRWGCPIHLVGERCSFDVRTVGRLVRLCRRLGVAIWHGHDYKSNLLGLVVRRAHRMKLLTTVHGWGDRRWRTRLYEKLDRWCLPRYDRVAAVSARIAGRCEAMGVEADRLVEIPNAIDPAEWTCELTREQARKKLGLPAEAMLVGSVSRLCYEKGIDRLLPVWREVARTIPSLRYVVVGAGPMEVKLRRQAERLGIGDRIVWAGWRRPVGLWYRAMDGLVLSSRTEGLPNTLLEAMVMDVPVAATDVGAVRRLLEDGRCGLVLANEPSRWAALLNDWLTNRTQREHMARRARRHVIEHYSFARRMERMAEQYDRLLGRATLDTVNGAEGQRTSRRAEAA